MVYLYGKNMVFSGGEYKLISVILSIYFSLSGLNSIKTIKCWKMPYSLIIIKTERLTFKFFFLSAIGRKHGKPAWLTLQKYYRYISYKRGYGIEIDHGPHYHIIQVEITVICNLLFPPIISYLLYL